MNLDELRTVQRTERQTDSLQHLRESFYGDVADYIAERKKQREQAAAAAEDPFASPEVRRLTDEIQTAEELVEAIYERRVGKVVKRASFAAAGMSTDEAGLTSEEQELFADLVARIQRNRETVLATLAGEDAADAPDAGSAPDAGGSEGATDSAADAGVDSDDAAPVTDAEEEAGSGAADVLADAMGGDAGASRSRPDDERPESDRTPSTESDADGESTADVPSTERAPDADARTPSGDPITADSETDATLTGEESTPDGRPTEPADEGAERVTLRITRNVGAILGVDDREYDLAQEDVVSLPAANAEPLIERDAADRLD